MTLSHISDTTPSTPWKQRLLNMARHVFLSTFALTCLFPLFWMARAALMTRQRIFTDTSLIPDEININNFAIAWTRGEMGGFFLNSVIYTVSVVTLIIIISSLAAYAFSRLRFPGKNFFFNAFFLAMMIPLPGSFVPLVVLMNNIGLANTRIGYILCMTNVGLPISIFLLKTFFDKMPKDLEDAATIDGCGKLRIWWNVALPMARPAIAVIAIFNALNVWNEYILAQLLLNDKNLMPIQTGLMKFQGAYSVDYPVLMAGLTIATAPVIVIYVILQKNILKSFSYNITGG
jgi:raffinose/stachyose/melibiose transport system permease protein